MISQIRLLKLGCVINKKRAIKYFMINKFDVYRYILLDSFNFIKIKSFSLQQSMISSFLKNIPSCHGQSYKFFLSRSYPFPTLKIFFKHAIVIMIFSSFTNFTLSFRIIIPFYEIDKHSLFQISYIKSVCFLQRFSILFLANSFECKKYL